jgi:hypothetical protein
MGCRRLVFGLLGVLAGGLAALGASSAARAQEPLSVTPGQPGAAAPARPYSPGLRIPLEELPAGARERVRYVVEHPTLVSHGPVETFYCQPPFYYWLLDHPDQAVAAWRGLGAQCTDIQDRGAGRFAWQDGQGSEVRWETVFRTGRQRVWYAEGRVRPGLLLPSVPVRAVVVLSHGEGYDKNGRPAVRHQMHLLLHTDSRAVSLATRLLGASAPRLAEQYVGQMQMFFGALAWYIDQHPDQAARLLRREEERR